MAEFAARATAGLTTGIIGTALGAVNSGMLGNLGGIFGGRNTCGDEAMVNRYEMRMQQELAAKDSRIALLESNIYVDTKIADVYERLNTKIGALEKQCCDQAVFNATVTSTQSCIANQVNALLSLTKLVVPVTSICPQPAVATTTATTT